MLFKSIFKHKLVLIHTAITDEECIKVKDKLSNTGIYHETKVRGIYGSSTRGVGWGRSNHNMVFI